MGLKAEVVRHKMPEDINVVWIPNGEHSFLPLKYNHLPTTKEDN